MKQSQNATDEQRILNDMSATLPPARSLADRIAILQEVADKIGPVDNSFDQKTFFDAP